VPAWTKARSLAGQNLAESEFRKVPRGYRPPGQAAYNRVPRLRRERSTCEPAVAVVIGLLWILGLVILGCDGNLNVSARFEFYIIAMLVS